MTCRNILQCNESLYDSPKANIILNMVKLKVYPLKPAMGQECLLSSLLSTLI